MIEKSEVIDFSLRPEIADCLTFSSGEPWFGIRTLSNREKTACSALVHKGYNAYLPVYREHSRWSDRTVEIDRPLFPGYVFCRFDPGRKLPILTTPGVVSIVGFAANEPAPIPDYEIEAIQAATRSGQVEPCSFLSEGQRIRVTRGPLQGVEGILVKKRSNWRFVVSVSMLQRSVSIEVDKDAITLAR